MPHPATRPLIRVLWPLALSAGLSAPALAAEPASCQTVRFADVGWTDITATTAVVSEILKGIGYKPTSQVLSVPVTYRSMKDKKIDVFLGNWMPSMEADIKPFREDGSVETLGPNLEGAKYTLSVPDYVAEAGVKTFADLAKNADKFKKKIYGIEPGNDGNRLILDMIKKNAFGLGGFKLVDLGEPKRGDVVVFIYPSTDASDPNRGNDFIKRVIGTPGDRIQYANKRLTVNGVEAATMMAAVQSDVGYGDVRMHEDFGGVKHDILIKPDRVSDPFSCPFVQPNGDNFEFTVPAGQYFMMGDNRDGSNDSRCWGTVPEANLKGRAELVWMSWDHDRARPVLSRIGTVIR